MVGFLSVKFPVQTALTAVAEEDLQDGSAHFKVVYLSEEDIVIECFNPENGGKGSFEAIVGEAFGGAMEGCFFSRFLRRTKPVDVLGPADGVGVGRPPVVGTAAAAADHLRENRGFVIVDEIELMGTLFSHVSGAFKCFFGNDGLVMVQNPVLH